MSQQAGARFDRLVSIMHTLRGPDGCPWDREQTLASLRPFVLEETYEVLEAIDSDDPTALIGLPLIRTCALLREVGLDPLAGP